MIRSNGKGMRLIRFVKRKQRVVLFVIAILVIGHLSGLLDRLFETDFSQFKYPLDIPNLVQVIDKRLNNEFVDEIEIINRYDYRYLIKNQNKCRRRSVNHGNVSEGGKIPEDILLMFAIKSAISHRRQRDAIRKTWASEDRFIDIQIKRIFVLGNCDGQDVTFNNGNDEPNENLSLNTGGKSGSVVTKEAKADIQRPSSPVSCQDAVDAESEQFQDIVQAEFIDNYYNNTIKTMMGLKWMYKYCPDAQNVLFVDDDYFVSIKNLLKYIRNPYDGDKGSSTVNGRDAINNNDVLVDPMNRGGNQKSIHLQTRGTNMFDGRLYSGYVFDSSRPMRHRIFSQWFIPISEYPYNFYPPYVTAGAFLLSNLAMKQIYLASNYVKHFKYDDIYIGILAKKINLYPKHNANFHFHKLDAIDGRFDNVIASHGYGDTDELIKVFMDMKSRGKA